MGPIELTSETLQPANTDVVSKVAETAQASGSSMSDTLQMVDQILSRIDSIMGRFGVNLGDAIAGQASSAPADPFGTHAFARDTAPVTRAPPPPALPPTTQIIDVTGEEPSHHGVVLEGPIAGPGSCPPSAGLAQPPPSRPEGIGPENSFTKEQLQNALDKIITIGGGDLTLNELRELSEELPAVIDVPSEVLE